MMAGAAPSEGGQAAFAAIQEIAVMLEADPKTDWTEVDIEGLRQRLIDMDNVTLRARVAMEDVDGGIRFTISGVSATGDSIRRMAQAHAATMNGVDGWIFSAETTDTGADLTVLPPDAVSLVKLRALGFIGVMARGMHHQTHHWMIATSSGPQH